MTASLTLAHRVNDDELELRNSPLLPIEDSDLLRAGNSTAGGQGNYAN